MAIGRRGQRAAMLLVLGALYVAQGLVAGFAGFVLLPTLAAAHVSLAAQTGLFALAGLPWVLKVFWGPVLDTFGARREGRARIVVTVAMVGIAATLLWMGRGLSDPDALTRAVGRVHAQWFLLSVLLSVQDVGTDALALDRVAPRDRGLANGVMLGGHHVGAEGLGGIALGAAVVAAGPAWGLTAMAGVFAVLSMAPMTLPKTLPGARSAAPEASVPRLAWGPAARDVLRATLGTPAARGAAALAAVIMVGDVLTSSVSGEFWVQRLGWSVERVSQSLPPLLLGASVAGYALAAVAVDKLGHARATALGAAALGALWIAFGAAEPWWTHDGFLRAFVVAQALATALMYVGVHARLMDATVPRIRATHFAVLMALLNLPRVATPSLAPGLLATLGFSGLFIGCGVLQLLVAFAARPPRSVAAHPAGS